LTREHHVRPSSNNPRAGGAVLWYPSRNFRESETGLTHVRRASQTEVGKQLHVARSAANAHAAREQAEVAARAETKGRAAATGAIEDIEASLDKFATPPSPDITKAHLHPGHVGAIESAARLLALAEDRLAEAREVSA
jgi:hypothetical protein